MRGGVALGDLIRQAEKNPRTAAALSAARQQLVGTLNIAPESLRGLRLAAGISQSTLAERSNSTQPYIARLESGCLDPGTDMLARIADGLGVEPVVVFAAVRAQRTRKYG
jgi:ribosome-binding protein aMBF1 (putative translation factor)